MFNRSKKPVKIVLSFLIPLAILYVIVCVAMFKLQRTLIYHPVAAQSKQHPILKLDTDSGSHFAVSAQQNESDHAVIYFGGNAEDVSQTIQDLVECFPNECVYAMHYPGYGASPGSPNQTSIVQNALALIEYVKARHGRISVIGRSLGSGVAMQVADRYKLDRLVLVTPFDSLAEVAQRKFPFLPAKWLVMDRFDSAAVAPKLNTRTLVLIAAQDEVIPRANSDRLVSLFPEGVCTPHIINPANHNSLDLPKDLLNQFLVP